MLTRLIVCGPPSAREYGCDAGGPVSAAVNGWLAGRAREVVGSEDAAGSVTGANDSRMPPLGHLRAAPAGDPKKGAYNAPPHR